MNKILYYIPLILCFFPAAVATDFKLAVVCFVLPVYFIYFIIAMKTKFLSELCKIFKLSTVKHFLFLYIWILISSILAAICGYHSFLRVIMSAIIGFLLAYILILIYPVFVLNKCISLKSFIKFLYLTCYAICIAGIIEFFARKYNIQFIIDIFDALTFGGYFKMTLVESHSSLPRIKAIFLEPSHFIRFIEINLPIIYSLSLSKFSLFKNRYFNLFIKKTMIPLAWICVILTQSPMGLLIIPIITVIYFYKQIFKFIIKYLPIVFFTAIFLIVFTYNMIISLDVSNSYLYRIQAVLDVLSNPSFKALGDVEESLAVRIINYVDQFLVFLKHPFIGIGFMNNGSLLIHYMEQAPIPHTASMLRNLYEAYTMNRIVVINNSMTQLLSQTGIIGFILYLNFMIQTIRRISLYAHCYKGIEFLFFNAIKNSMLIVLFISILYDLEFYQNIVLSFYIGIACALTYIGNKKYRLLKILKERYHNE